MELEESPTKMSEEGALPDSSCTLNSRRSSSSITDPDFEAALKLYVQWLNMRTKNKKRLTITKWVA